MQLLSQYIRSKFQISATFKINVALKAVFHCLSKPFIFLCTMLIFSSFSSFFPHYINIFVESDITFPSNYNNTGTNTFVKFSSCLANKGLTKAFVNDYLNGEFLPGHYNEEGNSHLRSSGGSRVYQLELKIGAKLLGLSYCSCFHVHSVFSWHQSFTQAFSPVDCPAKPSVSKSPRN